MTARRDDQAVASSSGIPTISRTLRRPAAAAAEASERSGEGQAEPGVQLGLQAGVVPLRGGHRGLEQHPPVQGQPPTRGAIGIADPDLVGERDVGVQVRVAGVGVAVVERRGQDAGGVQLLHPGVPAAGVDRLFLEPADGVLHGGVVGGDDLVGDVLGGDRP